MVELLGMFHEKSHVFLCVVYVNDYFSILGSSDLGCATAYRKPGSIEYRKPALDPSLKNVTQSYNIPPTCMVPVLVSTTANDSFEHYRPVERVLVAMRFGIIPSHSTVIILSSVHMKLAT